MVITLTLNPAIDRTIKVDEVNQKDVTRVKKTIRDAAGKGINVSKVISSLGGNTICTGFLAGQNGQYIKDSLSQLGISTDFITVDGETRENIKIQETNTGKVLEINEQGPSITKQNLQDILLKLDELLKPGDLLVISGSVPKGIHDTFYNEVIEKYNELGITTLLDTSLKLLKSGINSNPKIIKPNLYELGKLVHKELHTEEEIIKEAKTLCNNGIEEVIVSLGKDGSLYINKDTVLKVSVPSVKVESTVGAGDSFVGGLSYAMDHDYDLEKKLRFAAAVGTASCMTEGTKPGNKVDVEKIYEQTKIKEV